MKINWNAPRIRIECEEGSLRIRPDNRGEPYVAGVSFEVTDRHEQNSCEVFIEIREAKELRDQLSRLIGLVAPPQVNLCEVDALAQIIREVDGQNRLGAGTLAERIIERLAASVSQPKITHGHCSEKNKPGGCQLHNLQCGYPKCDQEEVKS